MRILFLSRWCPDPVDNGSKVRILHLLRGLCAKHCVTLISFFDPGGANSDGSLEDLPLDGIHLCPYREFNPRSIPAVVGYLRSTPRWLVDTHQPEMEELIRRTLRESRFDLIVASQIPMAAYAKTFGNTPAILEEAEAGAFWPYGEETVGIVPRFRRMLTWHKHRRYIARLLPAFRLCTVVSEVERQLLSNIAPGYRSAYVIPNGVNVSSYIAVRRKRTPFTIIFAGSLRFRPNLQAMHWFLDEILPIVKSELPCVKMRITGDVGSERVRADPCVTLTGRVPDVHRLVAASAVSVAPIRTGGGTRIKVLEAMALGSPVVATSKAVEGLDIRDGEHLLIRDSPYEFAGAVIELLRDQRLAQDLANRAYNLVRSHYDWRSVFPWFMQLIEQAAATPAGCRVTLPPRKIEFRDAY